MDVQKVTSDFVRLRDVLTFTVWALNFSFVSCQPWVQQVHPPKEQWGTKCDLSGQWSRGTNRRQKGDYQGHPLTIKYCKYLKQTALKFTRMHQNQCYLQKFLDGPPDPATVALLLQHIFVASIFSVTTLLIKATTLQRLLTYDHSVNAPKAGHFVNYCCKLILICKLTQLTSGDKM